MPIFMLSYTTNILNSPCMWVMKRLPHLRSSNVKSVFKTWGMYHTARKTAKRAVKMYEIKDYQLALVTFNMSNVRWSTFLSTIRMVIVLVVKVSQQ